MRNACDSDSRCSLACDASACDAKSLAMWVEQCEPLRRPVRAATDGKRAKNIWVKIQMSFEPGFGACQSLPQTIKAPFSRIFSLCSFEGSRPVSKPAPNPATHQTLIATLSENSTRNHPAAKGVRKKEFGKKVTKKSDRSMRKSDRNENEKKWSNSFCQPPFLRNPLENPRSKPTLSSRWTMERSGDPNPQYFSKSTAVQMGGVLQYKWEAYYSTNGRRIAGFPFLRSLEARKVRRYKWGPYCRTNWRCTAVLFRQVVGVGVSKTLPK